MQALTSYAPIAGVGYEGPNSGDVDLKAILTELQSITESIASPGATGTCVAVTGMVATDTIKSVIKYASGVPSSVTANYTAAAGGMLCASNADSNADALKVLWFNKDGA